MVFLNMVKSVITLSAFTFLEAPQIMVILVCNSFVYNYLYI